MNDFDIEQQLTAAMESRTHRVHPGPGSVRDVRSRARRRARRRAVGGAGAIVAVGAIGAVVLAARPEPPSRFADGNGGAGADARGDVTDGGFWRCTGPLGVGPSGDPEVGPSTTIVWDESIASTTTVGVESTNVWDDSIASTTVTSIEPFPPNFGDSVALYEFCEPVDGGVTSTSVALETAPSVERPSDLETTTTIIWPTDASVTTIEIPPTTTSPGHALDDTTTSAFVETATSIVAGSTTSIGG